MHRDRIHCCGISRRRSGKVSSRPSRRAKLCVHDTPIAPGDSAEVALTLMPGRHIVFCTYPLPGGTSVQLDSGMVREVVVAKPRASMKATPNASINALDSDATLIIGEYGYSTLPPLAPGHRRIRVTNAGRLAHQALLIRLPDGVKPNAELAWFRSNYTGTRPGIPAGGLLEIRPGETAWFSVWLRPGRYMLVCGFLDGSTHHFDKGLMRVIEVKPS